MDTMNMERSRRLAESWLDDRLQDSLAEESDEDRRRLLQTLYSRQKHSMEYLSLIHIDEGKPALADADEKPDTALALLMHPFVDLLGPLLLLIFILLELEAGTVIVGILLFMRAVIRLTHPAYAKQAETAAPEAREPYLLESEVQHFLQQQTDRIAIDAASIADRHVVTLSKERQGVADDAVEMYCALYEAQVDFPDQESLFYPLSMAKMSLLERGFEPVLYTESTASLFDVMPADCPSQLRYPAIRNRENGAIIKRGLYLRGR